MFHLLLALAAVIVAGRLLGVVFRWIGQPPVIAEVIAGILLGPSLLGAISPAAQQYLLPDSIKPGLEVIAQLGIILYMFVVGLELDLRVMQERGTAILTTATASIVVPFALGIALALPMYAVHSESTVSFVKLALFMGAALSITAFPVLARILKDRNMTRTPLGVMALTCAAMNDAVAWCLLAIVVGVAQAEFGWAIVVAGMTLAFIVFMFFAVRPLIAWLLSRLGDEPPPQGVLALVFLALLISCVATELIGIHAIFGAFLLGAVFPHNSRIALDLCHKLEDLVTVLLLPAFFAFTGMQTEIGLISGWENWLWCAGLVAIATAGKFGGTFAAAKLTGLSWRESAGLGVLMNTRGLMELIVLNIGLQLEIISPTVFAMMVVMAIVTTLATTPILQLITLGRKEDGLRMAAET
jgi:Kef-type K+ transport system membrane component KefB